MKTLTHLILATVLIITSMSMNWVFARNHAQTQAQAPWSKGATMRQSSTTHLRLFIKINSLLSRMNQQQLMQFNELLTKKMDTIKTTHPHYSLLTMLIERTRELIQWDNTTVSPSLVTLAINTPELSILKDIIIHLDLVDTLEQGTFTVFAPTNDAFAELLADLDMSFEELAANKELLQTVVLYHLLPWRVLATQVGELLHGTLVPTVWGESVRIRNSNGVYVDDSKVIATDIIASNGVVHLIDSVLLPPSVKTALGLDTDRWSSDIVSIASSSNDFSTLVAAVQAAWLVDALQGEWPFTVFAPTNDAFAELLASLNVPADELLANTDLLTSVLLYHVVPGFYTAADIVWMWMTSMLTTLQWSTVDIMVNNAGVMIDNARVTATDIFATNVVIHVIDGVLMP